MNTNNSVSQTTVESQAVNPVTAKLDAMLDAGTTSFTDFQVSLQHTASTPNNTPITHADVFGDAPMFMDHLYPSRLAAANKGVK